jgi:hypothetical protein
MAMMVSSAQLITRILSCTWSYKLGKHSQYSDLLQTGASGDRILEQATFSAPIQTSPGTHPASCTMGTGSPPWE